MPEPTQDEIEAVARAMYAAYAFDNVPLIGKIARWESLTAGGRMMMLHMAANAIQTSDHQLATKEAP